MSLQLGYIAIVAFCAADLHAMQVTAAVFGCKVDQKRVVADNILELYRMFAVKDLKTHA